MYKAILLGMLALAAVTSGRAQDTASKSNLKAAEEAVARSEAVVFALDSTSIYETDRTGSRILDGLTQGTGGFVLRARETSDLKTAFNQIERILRSQYALGYPPPDLEENGRFRRIEVTANKPGLRVHARKGYYAPSR